MLRVSIWSAVLCEGQFSYGESQDWGVLSPRNVERHQHAEQFGEIFCVVLGGDDICPRLFVAAGRGPARCFKQALQHIGSDGLVAEGARTPALGDEIVYRKIRRRPFVHERFLSLFRAAVAFRLKFSELVWWRFRLRAYLGSAQSLIHSRWAGAYRRLRPMWLLRKECHR